jgi:hypothetical protein
MRPATIHLLILFLSLLVPSCGNVMEDWQDVASGERAVIWRSADPVGAASLNASNTMGASYITMKSSGGLLYAGWYESDSYYHVKVYNNDDEFPQWTTLPNCPLSAGFNGAMEIHDGRVHVLTFAAGSINCFRMKSDLSDWETVGSAINTATPQLPLKLVSCAGRLYALWKDTVGIRMKRYDGGTSWSYTEDAYGYGINDANDTTYGIQAAVHNGLLFVAFGRVTTPAPHTAIKVRAFNGGGWATVGQGIDIAKSSVNFSQQCSMTSCNGSLYLLWREFNSSLPCDGLWVTRYNGVSWTRMDGRPTLARDGLRYVSRNDSSIGSTANDARLEALAVVNGRLVAAWREDCGPLAAPSANPIQLRCALFNGDETASAWAFIDGGLAAGLNVNSAYSVGEVCPVSHDSKLYIGFTEFNGSANAMHVKVGY